MIRKCERCETGQVMKDWDGLVCLQCGHRPGETVAQPKTKEHRIPRLPT